MSVDLSKIIPIALANSKSLPEDLADHPDPGPVKYLIEDFIPTNYPTSLFGDGGQGKSYIAMHIALSVITGKLFLNKKIVTKGSVLYLDWELDADSQTHRWGEVIKGGALQSIPRGLHYKRMVEPLCVCATEIYAWLALIKPQLVIIDSVGRASGSNPMDQASTINFLTVVESFGTSLLIDHQSRSTQDSPYASKREYGNAYKGHYVRCSWQVERVGQEDSSGIVGLVFRHKKANFGPLLADINATLTFKQLDHNKQAVSLIPASTSTDISMQRFGIKGRIMMELKTSNMTMEQLAESMAEFDVGSIRNEITALKRSGLVIETGKESRAPKYGLIPTIDPRMRVVSGGDSNNSNNS